MQRLFVSPVNYEVLVRSPFTTEMKAGLLTLRSMLFLANVGLRGRVTKTCRRTLEIVSHSNANKSHTEGEHCSASASSMRTRPALIFLKTIAEHEDKEGEHLFGNLINNNTHFSSLCLWTKHCSIWISGVSYVSCVCFGALTSHLLTDKQYSGHPRCELPELRV